MRKVPFQAAYPTVPYDRSDRRRRTDSMLSGKTFPFNTYLAQNEHTLSWQVVGKEAIPLPEQWKAGVA